MELSLALLALYSPFLYYSYILFSHTLLLLLLFQLFTPTVYLNLLLFTFFFPSWPSYIFLKLKYCPFSLYKMFTPSNDFILSLSPPLILILYQLCPHPNLPILHLSSCFLSVPSFSLNLSLCREKWPRQLVCQPASICPHH